MATTLEKAMNRLPSKRRARINARASQLIAEEMTLRDLRKAAQMTQKRIAELLDIGQDSVSRLEKRRDIMLSTLRGYIKALGGNLHLVVEFPGRPPVTLEGLAGEEAEGKSNSRGRR